METQKDKVKSIRSETSSTKQQDAALQKHEATTLELALRALALRHKLKVHDSMPRPDTHEEAAKIDLSRWELEDELHAIESLISIKRAENVAKKTKELQKFGVQKKSKKETDQ